MCVLPSDRCILSLDVSFPSIHCIQYISIYQVKNINSLARFTTGSVILISPLFEDLCVDLSD